LKGIELIREEMDVEAIESGRMSQEFIERVESGTA
jgi:hypothetical protein